MEAGDNGPLRGWKGSTWEGGSHTIRDSLAGGHPRHTPWGLIFSHLAKQWRDPETQN